MSLLRVLHVSAGNLYGGVETLLLSLARQRSLCPGIDQHFALFFEGRHSEELRGTSVPVHILGKVRVSRPWTVLAARRRLRQLLSERPFDVVVNHLCWNHAIVAPVARGFGVPVVFWAHMIDDGSGWVERWAKRSPPDFVVACSSVVRDSVTAHLFPGVRSLVLYPPISAPTLSDRAAARHQVRDELGTAASTVVVVTACRLEAWKGHQLLLDALGRLADRTGWECWIAGGAQRHEEERYLAGLRRQAERNGISDRVRFLGHRSDIARVLAAADVHCQPNVGPEPFGIAFIEALYAGLPVVTTTIGAAVEILDGNCGVLVPEGDCASLAADLGRLFASMEERRRIGSGGPARAAELCDPSARMGDLGLALREVRDRACQPRRS